MFYAKQFSFLAILHSMSLSGFISPYNFPTWCTLPYWYPYLDAFNQLVLFYDAITIFLCDALYHTDILIWMHFTIQIYSLYSFNIRCSFLYSPSEHPPPPRRVLQELLLSDNWRVCVSGCVCVCVCECVCVWVWVGVSECVCVCEGPFCLVSIVCIVKICPP